MKERHWVASSVVHFIGTNLDKLHQELSFPLTKILPVHSGP